MKLNQAFKSWPTRPMATYNKALDLLNAMIQKISCVRKMVCTVGAGVPSRPRETKQRSTNWFCGVKRWPEVGREAQKKFLGVLFDGHCSTGLVAELWCRGAGVFSKYMLRTVLNLSKFAPFVHENNIQSNCEGIGDGHTSCSAQWKFEGSFLRIYP